MNANGLSAIVATIDVDNQMFEREFIDCVNSICIASTQYLCLLLLTLSLYWPKVIWKQKSHRQRNTIELHVETTPMSAREK